MGRYDRSATLTDASGDFLTVGNPLPVSGTGGGGGGGTSQADKSSFGEGTGIGTPIMGVVNDTLGGLVSEDKAAAVRITPARGFHCNLRDVDGNEIGTASAPLRIDPTGSTPQPISGTVTVQDGGGSLTVDGSVSICGSVTVTGTVSAIQSGTWATQLTDGSLTASVRNTGVNDSLNVAITDASGDQITSFGGGTQYTDGDTDATPTGTLAVWFDTANILRAVSATKPLPVSMAGTVTVSGTVSAAQSGAWTVTANAGTGTFGVNQTNAATADYDVGAGTVSQVMFGVALPASGGPVAGGTATNPFRTDPTGATAQPITDNGGSLTVDGSVSVSGSVTVSGTVAATQSGTWNVGLNAGSNTVGKVDQGVGGASAWKVDGSAVTQPVSGTVAATQSGTWTVQQGSAPWSASQSGTWNVGLSTGANVIGAVTQSGSWTVTANAGSGTFGVAQTNLATADYDTGAGTVTESMMGIALPASGGPVAGGTGTNPLRVDPTGTTAQPVTDNGGSLTVDGSVSVSGTVAATQSGPWTVQQGSAPWSVSDGGGSLTVDGPLTDAQLRATPVPVSGTVTITDGSGPVTVDGTVAVSGNVTVVQATATNLKVDASGVAVPVTDNGGSLTVDGSVTVSGTVDTELPAAVLLGTGIANPTTPVVGGANLVWNGTSWDPFRDANQANGVSGALTSIGIPAFNPSVFDTTTGEYRRANSAASGVAGGLDGSRVMASGPMGYDGSVFYNLRLDGSKNLNVNVNAALPTGSSTIGKVDQGTGGTSAWKVDGSAVTQPVNDAGGSLTVDGAVTTTETRPGSTTSVVDLLSATDATRVLTILAANASRRGATIRNDTDTALLIREGGSASLTNYTDILPAGARYTLDYPASTGILTAYLPQVPQGQLIATERS